MGWGANHKRNTDADFKVRTLAPLAVLTKLPAVISGKDNNGVLRNARRVDRVENNADVVIWNDKFKGGEEKFKNDE